MEIFAIYLVLMFGASTALIALYVVTLLHNLKGSNYKLLSIMLGMLLVSNIATIFITWANYELMLKLNY